MDDWKKYDDDIVQSEGLLPWGCTIYNLLYRIRKSRSVNKESNHADGKGDSQEKHKSISNNKFNQSNDNGVCESVFKISLEQKSVRITSKMLSKILGKSIRTIQRMARDGRLPASRDENGLAWTRQDLEEIYKP